MGTNSGRYSKFQERLKRIVRSRFKRKKKSLEKQEQKQVTSYNKINEVREVIPDKTITKRNVNVKKVYVNKKLDKNKEFSSIINNKKNTTFLGDQYGYVPKVIETKKVGNKKANENKKVSNKKVNEKDLEFLGIEIIDKIKHSFLDKLDQLDVLQSELYLISVSKDEALEIKKVRELKEKIKVLMEEINSIIEEYNLYNKNYYMESFVGIEDRIIEDDIVNYRRLLDSSSKEKEFVKEYKMLEEFEKLYSKLILIKHDTEVIMEETEEKANDFDIRDKKYKNIVDDVIKVSDVEKECLEQIEKQNKYLNDLTDKIDLIKKEEYVTTHLRGVGELVGQSLKYVGLRILSPLSGIIPSIAFNTLMTRQLIGNIYKNIRYEDVKHVYYTTTNYDRELSSRIVDVDYTEDLILDTMDDIKKLKEQFLLQYDSNIPGYSETLKKINDIEDVIYRNQNKIEMIKKRLIQNKKINQNKLLKVKRLNENRNYENRN